jgi:hypothetical protein
MAHKKGQGSTATGATASPAPGHQALRRRARDGRLHHRAPGRHALPRGPQRGPRAATARSTRWPTAPCASTPASACTSTR